jgi:hypothetical protein
MIINFKVERLDINFIKACLIFRKRTGTTAKSLLFQMVSGFVLGFRIRSLAPCAALMLSAPRKIFKPAGRCVRMHSTSAAPVEQVKYMHEMGYRLHGNR